MSITTRRGDQGNTDLLFGHCVLKSHPRIHALGAVDELNAALGLLRVTAKTNLVKDHVPRFQLELIALMGELATPTGEEKCYRDTHPDHISEAHVQKLDGLVETMEQQGALKFNGWALPGEGGQLGAAHADLARTICRRAERCVIDLKDTGHEVPNAEIIRYLNRLSDVLWLMARMEEKEPAT
jgi:cob(I)alamin adenosyltransferase